MPIPLVRRPHEIKVRDADETRAWLMGKIRQDVLLKGCPHPKVHLVGHGFEETLDLDAMAKKDSGAHLGATFQALRSRPDVERRFVSMVLTTGDDDEAEKKFALLFEELDGFDGRRWWVATLEYTQDLSTGLGHPAAEWMQSDGETNDPEHLFPFLREIAFPPAGSRATRVIPPGKVWQPDMQVAFGDLPPEAPTPTTPRVMVELAAALAVNELLTGKVKGTCVVRIAGRSWEQWVLSGDMPGSLEEMVRWVANHRLPAADGVAIAHIAIRSGDKPPVPGIQIIAELGGKFCETWAPLAFPEGPAGPKVMTKIDWWDNRALPEGGMWLGIPSRIEIEEPEPEA